MLKVIEIGLRRLNRKRKRIFTCNSSELLLYLISRTYKKL